jgi:hypothetical protein
MTALRPADGVYELARDVANSRPDRRSKHIDSLAVWKAGMRLIVADGMIRSGGSAHGALTPRHPCWGAIVAALVPSVETVATVFETDHGVAMSSMAAPTPIRVIQRLVDAGKITLDDVRGALHGKGGGTK